MATNTVIEHKWLRGGRHGKLKIAAVAAELRAIRKRRGKLTAEIVIEESRATRAPLHVCFAWDDAQAAHQFRLVQARALIRTVGIVVERTNGSTERRLMREYEFIESRDEYLPIQTISEHPDLARELLALAYADLQSWVRRYESQGWFLQHFGAVAKVIAKVAPPPDTKPIAARKRNGRTGVAV